MKQEDLAFFDRRTELSVVDRALPHWGQAGTPCFITWRLADSLPRSVLHRLDAEIALVLRSENLPIHGDWKSELQKRDELVRGKVQWKLFAVRDKFLDAGSGHCLLAKPQHAEVVLKSLRHFDEQRYFLTDAVVMPNHVHLIAAFATDGAMLAQCESWKRYTARTINSAENRKGEFWQVDQFDHLIRSEEQFVHFRRYIRSNPDSTGLSNGEFLYYQKELK